MSRMMLSLNAALYSDAPKDSRASIEEIVPFKVLWKARKDPINSFHQFWRNDNRHTKSISNTHLRHSVSIIDNFTCLGYKISLKKCLAVTLFHCEICNSVWSLTNTSIYSRGWQMWILVSLQTAVICVPWQMSVPCLTIGHGGAGATDQRGGLKIGFTVGRGWNSPT